MATSNLKHGMHNTPEYRAWDGMKRRCHNPQDARYHRYGARGIAVYPAWFASFEAFYNDMGPRPTDLHSLERIDNNGPYAPDNCRWATRSDQARNRRPSRTLTYNGETLPLPTWAERIGISLAALYHRLNRGWTIERALTTPPRGQAMTIQR
jgi:hypothetical protein